MTHYAGIDVSLETSSICIVDGSGAVLRELGVESEPEALVAALTGTELEFARVGLEAGPMSQWLHAGLRAAGLPVLLLETRRLRAATKAMPVKTDRTDARAIAQMVRTGWFRAVHVKSELSQELQALLTARKRLVGKLRDIDNGIHGLLRGFGPKVGPVGDRAFPARARGLAADRKALSAVIEPLLQVREALLSGRGRLHHPAVRAARDDAVCRRLMTVPGVGPVTALTFRSAVDDPTRFGRCCAVGAHFGRRRGATSPARRTGSAASASKGMASPGRHSTRRRTCCSPGRAAGRR
jgi:transposase